MVDLVIFGVLFFYIIYKTVRSVRFVPTKSAYIIERLGDYSGTLDPGIHVLIPFIDNVAYIQDLKEETIDVDPQECFTEDNVMITVDGVMYISVMDPVKASYGIVDYRQASVQLAQTTIRSIIGTMQLDKTFEEREMISVKVVNVLSEVAQKWGINVHRYEIKNIIPPTSVRDAMEKEASAEREKRAIVAKAQGEKQSIINKSEGFKMELINQSEGKKLTQINEAEGKANEIESIATAIANSIEQLGTVLSKSEGEEAMKLQLSQQYLSALENIAREETNIILPNDLTQVNDLLKGLKLS